MTRNEIREAKERLGMSSRELAARLRCSKSSVDQWCQGVNQIPGPVAVAIELLLKEAGHGNG